MKKNTDRCEIVSHTDYKTTANIYTHVRDEMLRKATVNMAEVFGSRGKRVMTEKGCMYKRLLISDSESINLDRKRM